MAYLSTSERTEVLLETIADLEELVTSQKFHIDAAAAFFLIVATAKKHQSYPERAAPTPITPPV